MNQLPNASGLRLVSEGQLARLAGFETVRSLHVAISEGEAPPLPAGNRIGGVLHVDDLLAECWLDNVARYRRQHAGTAAEREAIERRASERRAAQRRVDEEAAAQRHREVLETSAGLQEDRLRHEAERQRLDAERGERVDRLVNQGGAR